MKKVLITMINLSLIFLLFCQSSVVTQAAYDNYNWFTTLRVEESQARDVVEGMKKYASTYETSYADNSRTIADLMEHFVFNSSIAPYKENHGIFPDSGNNISSFTDGVISSTFGASRQCYAFANYIESAAYGVHGLRNTHESIPNSKSAEDLKNFFLLYVQPGEHMLWSNQHSAAFVLATAEGVYYLHRLYNGEIVLSYFTYTDMSRMLIEKNVDFYVYNSCPGVNTILPSFSANVKEGIMTVTSVDYPCDFYVMAGFRQNNMQKLLDYSALIGASTLGTGTYDIEESFQMCPSDGQTLYYQIFFECLGKQYHTKVLSMEYDAKPLQVKEETNKKEDKSLEKVYVIENQPYLSGNEVTVPEKVVEEKEIEVKEPSYGAWSDWQETPIYATATLEVETKTVEETVAVGTHKEFNYSYYSYMNGGTKYYTWSRDFAMKMGGSGERVYRGWGNELFLYTLYDGVEWGSQYVDGGIWFFEEVREVEDTKTISKTYYRSRTVS